MSDTSQSATIFNVKEYIDNFNIIDKDMANMIYGIFLKKFQVQLDAQEYELINEYQETIISFVEDVREHNSSIVRDVLIYFDKILPCLADIIIMQWCLPRANQFHSKIMYNKNYKMNIQSYNHKLVDNIDLYVIRNFAMESIIKNNNVPVHCIDLIWYWIKSDSQLEFSFCNSNAGNWIGITIEPDDEFIQVALNMESILELGLGNVICKQGTFKNLIKGFVYDTIFVNGFMKSATKKNYEYQSNNIKKKSLIFFD